MEQTSNIPCQACGFDPTKTVTYCHEETVRFKWKSGNVINPYGHKTQWVYRSYRKGFCDRFSEVAHRFSKCKAFRRVTLTRVYGAGPKGGKCYPYDTDNLAQGAKPIVDALVKDFALLLDDTPSKAEIIYKQEESMDGKHYIRIKIEEFA